MEEIVLKKKRLLIGLFITALSFSLLTGCGGRETSKNHIDDLTTSGEISDETSTLGLSLKDVEKREKEIDKNGNNKKQQSLLSNGFYVLHEDKYYPLVSYVENDREFNDSSVDSSRLHFFTTANEHQIPTLFLEQGDKLIYYSTDNLLDYIIWERWKDLDYTIGIHNIQQMTNTRSYVELSEDTTNILEDSELFSLYDLKKEFVLLDKIGGVQIIPKMIENGLLTGCTKSKQYDLEVYAGTKYMHFLTTANIHAFQSYELFASIEYETKQAYMYEITIPEYLVDGYYSVNDDGIFRLVLGSSYNEETDFNVQLLYPEEEKDIKGDISYGVKAIYSEFEPLNKFKTNVNGTLGYKNESDFEIIMDEEEEPTTELQEAVITERKLVFPKDIACEIIVTSPTLENTGDCYVTIGSRSYPFEFDAILGKYTFELTGNDEVGIMTISGLREAYDIDLIGCILYEGSEREATDLAVEKEKNNRR